MIRVVCWKWKPRGPKRDRIAYTAEHVNKLASGVDRHLRMPHEMVCITDDPEGIDGSVRIVPLWEDLRDYGMCWLRLKVFSDEMADVIGPRFVSIDLDTVIVGGLDPLLDIPHSFAAWRNVGRGATYCGSMFLMDAGARQRVWDEFDASELEYREILPKLKNHGCRYIHPRAYEAGHVIGSDQAWMSYVLGPDEHMWDERDGVLSHRDERFEFNKLGLPQSPELPEDARVVFFHGSGDPAMDKVRKRHPWIEEHWV